MCQRLEGNFTMFNLSIFTLSDARAHGVRKDEVYKSLATGEIERNGIGVYYRPDRVDPALVSWGAASARHSKSTLCLTSALAYHGLSDAIPASTDIALPRGTRLPAGFEHVTWHLFDAASFELGRIRVEPFSGMPLYVYSAERTIVDCFRLAYREGSDVAHTALKRWLRQNGNTAAKLLEMAASFPRTLTNIRQVLEILL
jgi:predicted transcriptional regulator of viral defense system